MIDTYLHAAVMGVVYSVDKSYLSNREMPSILSPSLSNFTFIDTFIAFHLHDF